jgi:hypothetical protein
MNVLGKQASGGIDDASLGAADVGDERPANQAVADFLHEVGHHIDRRGQHDHVRTRHRLLGRFTHRVHRALGQCLGTRFGSVRPADDVRGQSVGDRRQSHRPAQQTQAQNDQRLHRLKGLLLLGIGHAMI